MIDGFYSIVFETSYGVGGGTVTLEGGTLRGGDSTMYYIGSYRLDDERLHADIHVGTHFSEDERPPVFGVRDLDLKVTGKLTVGFAIEGSARSPQRPDSVMIFKMTRIAG